MNRIVWKFSFILHTFNDNSTFCKKDQFFLLQKTTNWQSWKFSKVKFWHKPRIQNSAKTKLRNLEFLTQLTCIIFLSWLEKCFEVTDNVQTFKREGDWDKLRIKICLLRQNIKHKVKKYSKIGQDLIKYLNNII